MLSEVEEKAYELTERQFEQYVNELLDWIEGWETDCVDMDEEEWEHLYEIVFDWCEDEYGLFEDWLEDFEEMKEETDW
jgi:hypothetical protein